MQFQKKTIPTPRMAIENPDGKGVSIAKICKINYEAKLEITGGDGFKPKKNRWGRYDYFLEQLGKGKRVHFLALI